MIKDTQLWSFDISKYKLDSTKSEYVNKLYQRTEK